MNNSFLLETERLIVRRFKEDDAKQLHLVLSDAEVMKYIEKPFTLKQTEEFIKDAGMISQPLVYAVVWKKSETVIGHLIWHKYDEKSMELGWIISSDFWGKGIATELTEAILQNSEHDVIIECSENQAVTRHIAEKFGFELVNQADGLLVYRRCFTNLN